MTKLRAAIENKIKPSSLLFQEQPNGEWTKFDFLLLEAYQILQDETCQQCGNPIWICHNEFADNVGFKIKTVKCFAKAELEKHQERQQKKDVKKKTYGQIEVVVPYAYDGTELPTRRGYLEAQVKSYLDSQ